MKHLLKTVRNVVFLGMAAFTAAIASPANADVFGIIVDQNAPESLQTIGKAAGKLAASRMAQGDTLVVYDGTEREIVKTLTIPDQKHMESPKFRISYLRKHFGEVIRFIKESKVNPAPVDDNNLIGLFRDFSDNVLSSYPKESAHILLAASSLYEDKRQPGYGMRRAAYPSDAHLLVDSFASPFGSADRSSGYAGAKIHFCRSGDEFVSSLHESAVTRFWSLYFQAQGGDLNSITNDTDVCLERFLNDSEAARTYVIDKTPKKPTMIQLKPLVWTKNKGTVAAVPQKGKNLINEKPQKRLEFSQGGRFLGKDIPVNSDMPAQTVSRFNVGISWECEDCDLDLYVAYGNDKPLYFKNKTTSHGKFFKDWRGSPAKDKAFEFIQFTKAIDAREIDIAVNFFKGNATNGVSGTARIWLENQDGVWEIPFYIKAKSGDGGKSNRTGLNWIKIDPDSILGTSGIKG